MTEIRWTKAVDEVRYLADRYDFFAAAHEHVESVRKFSRLLCDAMLNKPADEIRARAVCLSAFCLARAEEIDRDARRPGQAPGLSEAVCSSVRNEGRARESSESMESGGACSSVRNEEEPCVDLLVLSGRLATVERGLLFFLERARPRGSEIEGLIESVRGVSDDEVGDEGG